MFNLIVNMLAMFLEDGSEFRVRLEVATILWVIHSTRMSVMLTMFYWCYLPKLRFVCFSASYIRCSGWRDSAGNDAKSASKVDDVGCGHSTELDGQRKKSRIVDNGFEDCDFWLVNLYRFISSPSLLEFNLCLVWLVTM